MFVRTILERALIHPKKPYMMQPFKIDEIQKEVIHFYLVEYIINERRIYRKKIKFDCPSIPYYHDTTPTDKNEEFYAGFQKNLEKGLIEAIKKGEVLHFILDENYVIIKVWTEKL